MAWHRTTTTRKRHYFPADDPDSGALCRSYYRDEAAPGAGDERDDDPANCRACASKVAALRRRQGPRSADYRAGYRAGYAAGRRHGARG